MATIEELKKRMEGVHQDTACPHCGIAEQILPMDTVIFSNPPLDAWYISKDGQSYYHLFDIKERKLCISILKANKADEDFAITLQDIEKVAKQNPGVWRAHIMLALRDATYERSDCGTWVLVETGRGYA